MRPLHLSQAAIAITLVCVCGAVSAQQRPAAAPLRANPNESVRSPEVQSNRHVRFRLYAPDARVVKLRSEGMEATPGISPQELTKASAGLVMSRGQDGVWSIDFGPIQPGAYRYTFDVDGVQTTDPRNPAASETLTSVKSMYEVPGAAFEEYRPDVPHGSIASVWYESKAVGGLRRMHIYTPPGYERDNRSYPVLYLLHGGGDSDDSWPTVGRAGAILDNLVAAYQAVPMIVVMPAGHMSLDFQVRSGLNMMGHDQFDEDMTDSIIPYVDRTYRTIADRDHRAIAGLSMGGLQVLTLSLTNSDLFS